MAAFPDIDLNNLPADVVEFKRVEPPVLGPYEKNLTVSYKKVGDFWTDVFSYDVMTAEEKAAKQQQVKDQWSSCTNCPSSWTFDEELCAYVAPTPRPDDNNKYAWRESDLSWVYVPEPPIPSADEIYNFDVESERWIKVTS